MTKQIPIRENHGLPLQTLFKM